MTHGVRIEPERPPPFHCWYEDSSCFVFEKPALLHSVTLSESAGKNRGGDSLAAALTSWLPSLATVAERAGDGGLVHRLDFETSGGIVVAKHEAAWKSLRAQVQSGELKKVYLVVVEGTFPESKTVHSWIGARSRSAEKVRVFTKAPSEKYRALHGTSHFAPLGAISLANAQDTANAPHRGEATLVAVVASPARRHQVRAHAAHLGYPLRGDVKYGSKHQTFRMSPSAPTVPPFVLHSTLLSFVSPETGAPIEVLSPLPATLGIDFEIDGKVSGLLRSLIKRAPV